MNPSIERPGFDSEEHQKVQDFLKKYNLPQYIDTFIAEGFESLSAVLEITEEDLIALNVKRGHRRVIQRGIAILKGLPKNQPLCLPNSNTTTTTTTTTTVSSSTYRPSYSASNHNNETSSAYASGYGSMSSPRQTNYHDNSVNNYRPYSVEQQHPLSNANPQQTSQQKLPPIYQVIRGIEKPYSPTPSFGYPSNKDREIKEANQSEEEDQTKSIDDDEDEEEEAEKQDTFDNYARNNNNNNHINDENSNNNNNSGGSSSGNSSEDSPSLKRKYKRHPKPDRNAPIKPPSAYIMFSTDARSRLKHHNMTFIEMAKLVGDQWKNLDNKEKQAYERTAMKAKDEYLDVLHAYKQTDQYKDYQKYLNSFKTEQKAINRRIARLSKKTKRDSSESGSLADNSSSNENIKSSSSSGSLDIYKVHQKKQLDKTKNKSRSISSNEEGSSSGKNTATPSMDRSSTTTTTGNSSEGNNPSNCEDTYSPQQKAPPLMSDEQANANYHRLPFDDKKKPK
ncbi:uncharacterized protein B0P05DRAFT_587326 [Gilbertella persicaria]|uniref:uncharacterized protein n=1 Tax=Gilbertella persicaria TaxID=101096 RepID=UPI00221F458B|nr:uncharacterized protein B0P05DRAFT_587326 [Gilbertella persicaria]KAI8079109.1 hypothetical protein B0P05DRAFT_587326 [Gilbertella persicaria]